jgi:hypothetical protein
MQQRFAVNAHLLPNCGWTVTFRKNNNCQQYSDPHVTDVQITRYYNSDNETIARILRLTFDDGREAIDVVKTFRAGNTVYNLIDF